MLNCERLGQCTVHCDGALSVSVPISHASELAWLMASPQEV